MLFRFLLLLCALVAAPVSGRPLLVLAPSSMQGALDKVAKTYPGDVPVISYAGTSTLARQVLAGAEADVFISADAAWMATVARANRIDPASRTVFAGNRLVLIAPLDSTAGHIARAREIAPALRAGRLAIADPGSVPAGRYAAAALSSMGVWPVLAPRSVRTENVRAALALVERGAAPLGIVYATDALASDRVRIAAVFPQNTHAPIRYFAAAMQGAAKEAAEFISFLHSARAKKILRDHGFGRPR